MKRRPFCALALCVSVGLFGCERPVLIGRDCPRCEQDQLCHPQLLICVACVHDADCAHVEGRPWCDPTGFGCVQCIDAKQCTPETPLCVEGACRPCAVDPASCPAPQEVTDAAVSDEADAGTQESTAVDAPPDGRRRRR